MKANEKGHSFNNAAFLLKTELAQAKAVIQSESSVAHLRIKGAWDECEAKIATREAYRSQQLAGILSESQQSQYTNANLLREYSTTCRSLDLAQQQLTHIAQRANDAAIVCGYKDEELKRNALENENMFK